MPLRPPAGFISANFDPLRNPDAPTGVTASAGDAQASVSFTAPANVGGSPISAYYAVSNPGQITASGASSPVTVTGLSNGTAYTFQVWALNSFGPGAFSAASGSVTPDVFQRGIIFPGSGVGIQYISINSTGNSTNFGNLLTSAETGTNAAGASSTRALYTGFSAGLNDINYVTIASTGNALYFGDMNYSDSWVYLACMSNATRCLWATGYQLVPGSNVNNISYVTIASTGNAVDFGDAQFNVQGSGGCSSPTRGVLSGGFGASYINVIQYVTISSIGNAIDFGDLISNSGYGTSCSSNTRGLHAIGYNGSTVVVSINYFTIATTGNASNFGDLTVGRFRVGSSSSPTRGVFFGGLNSSFVSQNIIDYVTISTTGNATDFGDLLSASSYLSGTSNCHGGL